MSEENLKACAHCGSKCNIRDDKRFTDSQNFNYWIECENDACGARSSRFDTVEDAIKAHNTRQSPDVELVKEVNALHDSLRECIVYEPNNHWAHGILVRVSKIQNKLQGSQS